MPVVLSFHTNNLNYIGKGHIHISRFRESASFFGILVSKGELAIALSHSENTQKIKLGVFSAEWNYVSNYTSAGRELVIELTHKHSLEFFSNLHAIRSDEWELLVNREAG